MNYSRRQLYALGEPLGESVTRLKPGGRVYGGGGSPSTPEKTTQVIDLPDWAKGYAKDTLSKTSALTDISQNPYQQYGGERIAGFQPMQQQAFEGAAGMQPSQQVGLGSGIAGAAGLGALSTNYQGRNFRGGQFDTQAAEQYMSPYTQNVVDYQKSQALRDFQIAQPMRQAQAVQQGAFGGSRSAIVDAEAQRSLNSQLQGITATGQQAAFQNAQQQFNTDQARRLQAQQMGEQSRQYGAGLGMQGLQTGLQAAGQLGQLGQTEYGQKMGINQLQSAYGQQQQQQAQRPLDMAYQDFINQQNYPYKQLGFMSDMIRGLPLGQQSTSQVYQGAGPGTVQTLAGLGGAAYGFGKSGMFGAEGGLMTSYADGGVTSDQNVESILGKLSDQQLTQAKETALNRQDVAQAQMIDAEMAERASIRGGLGGAFNQIPVEQQEEMMAGGGIVAFAKGGNTYKQQFESSMETLKGLADKSPPAQTPEQYEQGVTARQPMLEKLYGEDVTKPYLEETKSKRAALADQMEKDKGLALAMASLGLLSRKRGKGENQKDQLISGLGEAGQMFIGEVGKLKKENREADDKLRQSEITLATAQQARKEGMVNKAMSLEDKAEALKQDAFKTKIGVQEKVTQLMGAQAQTEMQGENALKVAGVNAATSLQSAKISAAKETDLNRQTNIRYAAMIEQGKPANKQTMAEAAAMAANDLKQSDVRRETAAGVRDDKFEARVDSALEGNVPYMKAMKKGDFEEMARIRQGVAATMREATSQAAPQAAPASSTALPPQAVDILKKNPSPQNIQYFDQTFGQGAAARALGK